MLYRSDGTSLSATAFGAIRNVKISPEITSILYKMKRSYYRFHLTGSFSVDWREPEDIDFFCCNDSGVRAYLKSLGFISEFLSYADSCFKEVLSVSIPHCFLTDSISKIHVQLIFPHLMDKKLRAQIWYEELSPYLSPDLSKDRLRSLWETLMQGM